MLLFFLSTRTLGTPDDELWRGVTSLPDYKSTFPKWPRQQLQSVVKGVSEDTIDLLEVRREIHLLGKDRQIILLLSLIRRKC